MVVIVMN